MKKKAFAILLSASLAVAMPFSALAARSSSTSSSSGGSSSSSSTSAASQPSGTTKTTADGQSLSSNGAGSLDAGVEAVFAVGEAQTAGLPEAVVSVITSINAGANLAEVVGNPELGGYAALTQTSAIVLNDKTTNTTANKEVSVSLYIPNLISGLQNVKILIYENATGQWKVVEPTAIDFENKTVTFNMNGSGTVTVIHS